VNIFNELSIVIVVAAVLSGLMRLFKQPLVIGYVLTGLFLGPQFLNIIRSTETVSIFSEMGIAILLFIVGIHLSPNEIKDLGKKVFIIGLIQVLSTSLLSYLISNAFNFSLIESLYLGISISFSSTIIVLKLLSDKRDLEKLYGRISIGILLLQDVVASFVLIFSSSFSSGEVELSSFFLLIIKGLILTISISLASVYLLPSLSTFFAKSPEYLFLFSLAWGFGMASVFGWMGFSIEIGALVAGVSLSFSPYGQEIASRLKTLRDFFLLIFFVLLGSRVSFDNFSSFFIPFLVFLLFIIIVKPIIITVILELFGYTKKTSFLTGISLAQISEFSFILLILGSRLGHISEEILSLGTLLGFTSIAVSTYFIVNAEKIYPLFAPLLSVFESKNIDRDNIQGKQYEVILFGCNRSGYDFIRIFKYFGRKFLAVDFDPDVIKQMQLRGINCCYGDAEDTEFLEDIDVYKAKIVISTIPDFDTNSFLLKKIRKSNKESIVFLVSYNIDEAIRLYEDGATYIILPHFIGGEFAAKLATEAGFDMKKLINRREDHLKYLRDRKSLGHSHPIWVHH